MDEASLQRRDRPGRPIILPFFGEALDESGPSRSVLGGATVRLSRTIRRDTLAPWGA
jgi:hypothetical protein